MRRYCIYIACNLSLMVGYFVMVSFMVGAQQSKHRHWKLHYHNESREATLKAMANWE